MDMSVVHCSYLWVTAPHTTYYLEDKDTMGEGDALDGSGFSEESISVSPNSTPQQRVTQFWTWLGSELGVIADGIAQDFIIQSLKEQHPYWERTIQCQTSSLNGVPINLRLHEKEGLMDVWLLRKGSAPHIHVKDRVIEYMRPKSNREEFVHSIAHLTFEDFTKARTQWST